MKYILIINGSPRSGKNVFIDHLYKISDIPVFEYSSIDYIKKVAQKEFRWDKKKDAKGRKLLATLKDAATEYNDLIFKKLIEKERIISALKDSFFYCICVREPKEIKKLVDFYDKIGYKVSTILVRREQVEDKEQSNSADEGVFDYLYDYYLHNSQSLGEFKQNIKVFYEDLLQKV